MLTTSISIERHGNCFLVNFILIDLMVYLNEFKAFDSCSGWNLNQISSYFSSTPSIENCSKNAAMPMFAHTNGIEFTDAPALLKYMPVLLILQTARFVIFANVTTISATTKGRNEVFEFCVLNCARRKRCHTLTVKISYT